MWDAFLIWHFELKEWIPAYASNFDLLSQNFKTCTNVTKCTRGGRGLELLASN